MRWVSPSLSLLTVVAAMSLSVTAQGVGIPSFVRSRYPGLSLREHFSAPVQSFAIGGHMGVALLTSGAIECWGAGLVHYCDPWTTPITAPIVEIAAAATHILARCADGSVVAQGINDAGACSVPPLPPGTTYVRVHAALACSFAVRSDGEVVAFGQAPTIPAHLPGIGYAQVAFHPTSHLLARMTDGSMLASGDNTYGQCDLPTLPPGVSVISVATGYGFSMALLSDGTLRAWGNNSRGQCNVPTAAPGLTFTAIATAEETGFALRSDGSVLAWGGNDLGLANVPVLPSGVHAVALAASPQSACAGLLASDGTVRVWGHSHGQPEATVPACIVPAAGPGSPFQDVSISPSDITVLRKDHSHAGATYASGGQPLPAPPPGTFYRQVDGNVGLRSDGVIVGASGAPLPTPGNPFVAVAAGPGCHLALREDGSIAAFGDNSRGQCDVPISAADAMAIAVGGFHSLALLRNGYVETWGIGLPAQSVPIDLQAATQVCAGGRHSLVLHRRGVIEAIGSNSNGQLNVPALPPGMAFVQIAAGWNYSGAIRSDGQAFVWGGNNSAMRAVPPPPPGVTYLALEIGEGHALGLRSDGQLVAWGANNYGECNVPTPPPGVTYVEAAAGSRFSVARRSDGGVVAWGGTGGQYVAVPSLPGGLAYVEITATHFTAIARRSDGALLVWGNPTGAQGVPSLPPGLTYAEVAVGLDHCAARRSDGSVVVWGTPSHGLLNVPTLPAGLTYVQVSSGRDHVLAKRSDGAWVAWGDNSYGQSTHPPFSPAVQIAAGRTSSYAVCADGSIRLWGNAPQIPSQPLPPGATFVEVHAHWQSDSAVTRIDTGEVRMFAQPSYWDPITSVPVPGAVLRRVRSNIISTAIALEVWGPPIDVSPLGPGCAGALPVTDLVEQHRPPLGTPLHFRLDNLPMDAAFVGIGFSSQPAMDLSSVGAPGCLLHVNPDLLILAAGSSGTATLDLLFPSSAPIGASLHLQALVLDPSANNLGAVLSNAVTATLVGK